MFKPTQKRLETRVVVGGCFKEVYEFARKGMNILGGCDGTEQEGKRR